MGSKGMKYTTYERCTNLTIKRFEKIISAVKEIEQLAAPLNSKQVRSLAAYSTELKAKKSDFDLNLKRVLEHLSSDDYDEAVVTDHDDKVQTLYIEAISMIEILLPPTQDASTPTSASSIADAFHTPTHVKLPKLDLIKFDGSPLQWVSFINLFDTSIHRNTSIVNVTKFQYLLSVLSGEPLSLIRGLDITPQNYLTAYQLLRDRYHSPRRLTTLHLNHILDLPNVSASNTKGLRHFINTYYEHTQALTALKCDITASNPLLSALLLRKLDQELRKRLENYRSVSNNSDDETSAPHTLPTIEEIIKFLTTECNHVEDASLHFAPSSSRPSSSQASSNVKNKPQFSKGKSFTSRDVTLMSTNTVSHPPKTHQRGVTPSPPCFVCDSNEHKVYTCSNFKSLTPNERYQLVKKHNRCNSCLGNHNIKNCQSEAKCFTCKKPHHTLLHFDKPPTSAAPTSQPSQAVGDIVMVSSQGQAPPSDSSPLTVVLGTALVKLTGQNGQSHVFRALLDGGSMGDFISEHAAQLLGATRQRSDVVVTGLSNSSAQTRGLLHLDLDTLSGDSLSSQHPFYVLNKIAPDLPRSPLSSSVLRRTHSFVLADPTFHLPSTVDVLLGNRICPGLLTAEIHPLGQNMPYLIGTKLGFVVMGEAPCLAPSPVVATVTLHSTNDVILHDQIQKFWVQEHVPEYSKKGEEESYCDEHFLKTHSRDSTGRYIVKLPFKPNSPALGGSHHVAVRRFQSLENKFKTQPQYKRLYVDFMRDYETSGHMTKVDNVDLTSQHYFLPHHGVLKQKGDQIKLRTVFDASSKTSSSMSLNDILLTGKKLQTNICDILIHYRTHDIVFSCDVRQMYRNITLDSDDQKYQLILWRENPDQLLATYQLTTVTYGMNSSPYLAIRTLSQLAEDEGHHFPDAAEVLRKNTYVDDIIAGASTEEAAVHLRDQLVALLHRGGFELRKWCSNSTLLLEGLPKDHLESPVFIEDTSQPHFSILGLHWSPESDCFSYRLDLPHTSSTKRSILSTVAKVYDPCGFLSPITMWCKLFIQILWTLGLAWDEAINPELAAKWQSFVGELTLLKDLQIPRPFHLSQARCIEMHGFCDASEAGYAAVIYLRCELPDGTVIVRQVIAKTRVAPLKRLTLPRLELCGAHLLAQLADYCLSLFKSHTFSSHYLWCDSTVALTWLKTPPYRLKTFVANRVSQAQEWVPTHWWNHIHSEHNPADCASRGILPSHLPGHRLWWNGPDWLQLPHSQWPSSSFTPLTLNSSDELKPEPLPLLISTVNSSSDFLKTYSSWTQLKYVVAYILRFIHNCKREDEKRLGPLSIQEFKDAEIRIFKLVQHEELSDEIAHLKKNSTCSARLQRLHPYLDSNELLRVGGRLQETSLPADARHPVILPKNHHVVDILIDYIHLKHLHSGAQLTQSILAQQVWILSARSVIRSRIFKCITCFKNKPTTQAPLMGNLPSPRITPSRPFTHTGMDYAGPYLAKIHGLRGIRSTKIYLCVFVCLSTKAVHIEVVEDLTTAAFIAALTRFVSRRGLCTNLYSDCATNFVGACNSLKMIVNSLDKGEIHTFSVKQGIAFNFNPPAAPHQGGLWEAAIKSMKHHLKRVIGDSVLTLPQFITLATQVEAVLNSRPLTPLSGDPSDLSALTPGHFLIGCSLTAVPEIDHQETPLNRLKHWQLAQALHQRIWKRWQLEYLNTLQQRLKWSKSSKNLKINDLVLVHQPTPPLTWPLARVEDVSPGRDGVVRVVHLKTAQGRLTRPAHKVFPLPCNSY